MVASLPCLASHLLLQHQRAGAAQHPQLPSAEHVVSMAAELESRCPICLDSWEEASYVVPCLHQFCYLCIVRWAESKPECPLCKRRVSSILHSVRADDDFREHIITAPATPSPEVQLAGGAPGQPDAHGLPHPVAAQPPAVGPWPMAPGGGFNVYIWAFIFHTHLTVLQPLLPWLHQEVRQLSEDAQQAAAAQSLVLFSLCCFGLGEETLIQLLQDSLGTQTRSFVHQLADTIVHQCSSEARHQMGLKDARAAEEQEGSLAAAPKPAASRERSSATSCTLQVDAGSSLFVPFATHREQEEQQQEDPEDAVPGPSTRTHRHNRSCNQSSQHSRGRTQQAPKRQASSPGEPSQPHHCW